MGEAVVGAIAGVGGALIGALAAFVTARRASRDEMNKLEASAEVERKRQLSDLALEIAKDEIARNPDSTYSLAAHWKVLEGILGRFDVAPPNWPEDSTDRDSQGLLQVADRITRMYCSMCGGTATRDELSPGGACPACFGMGFIEVPSQDD